MFYLDNNDVTQTVLFGNPNDTPLAGDWDGNGIDGVGVRREGMLYLTKALSGVGALYQSAFYGLPSDMAVVGVWREGMLYLTNTLNGVGAVYQTAFYGLAGDVAVVGVWRSARRLPYRLPYARLTRPAALLSFTKGTHR